MHFPILTVFTVVWLVADCRCCFVTFLCKNVRVTVTAAYNFIVVGGSACTTNHLRNCNRQCCLFVYISLCKLFFIPTYSKTLLTQTLGLHRFFGLVKSPWFYTEMPTDNMDSVSMDFVITQTPFPPPSPHRVPKYTG